ncbi:MAG TPA: FAD/NAD(P)-binding protein [Planctomycetaceae bacterium]|nr:FAD/NAD(P)-binding protein [Planctomycetaceae bacterium]
MHDLTGPLADLVRRLDASRGELSLVNITRALNAVKLSASDVAAYVHRTPRFYHREPVVRREHYELLILTWLPGQGSVPHDHAGSVSAMQVLDGEAIEGCWRVAPDGYVDLEYETSVPRGEMTAWQDAGVHTVYNPSKNGTALVTVHVYAPPLRDFRRYVSRPTIVGPDRSTGAQDSPNIVIVGGGFCGVMTAAQILRDAARSGLGVNVVVVERQGAIGEGLAYGTRDLTHLLNVPAGRMSAWPDRPDDFVAWASRRLGPVAKSDFLPRQWYGEYVRESLLKTAQEAGPNARLNVIYDEVRRIARHPQRGWMVHFARGASRPAEAIVLAIGHRPPPDPIGRLWTGSRNRFIADPWRPFATNVVAADEPVVILGSGLTAVDAVLSLSQEPRQAPITLISRHGLLPQPHAQSPVPPADLQGIVDELLAAAGGVTMKTLFRAVRRRVRAGIEIGQDWRSIVDGLRPHTARLWQAMPTPERRRFLTELRPYWEVHRHRMAVGVAEQFKRMLDSGAVRIVTGQVASAHAEDDSVRLYVRERGDDRLLELHTAWVVNCTGPTASNSAESNPAIASLLVHGLVRPDELELGLETTADGNAIDVTGAIATDLFVVGTLRKPGCWESTAVLELRTQAQIVAERALKHVHSTIR